MTYAAAGDAERIVYLIDVTNEIVLARRCVSVTELARLIGGRIEWVLHFNNGDHLVVDEHGLSKANTDSRGFQLDGKLFIGNGVIVGLASAGKPAMPLERLRPRVHFMAVRTTHGRAGE